MLIVTPRRRHALVTAAIAAMLAACGEPVSPTAAAPDARFDSHLTPAAPEVTELFISEYIEGSSNNKAIEIYNGTGAAIDLAAAGYNVQMYFNGSSTAGLTINLTGTVASGDVYVVAQSAANAAIIAQADQTNGSGWFNGDDAIVLRKGTTIVDAFGQIGFDPGAEWGTGLVSTADNTLRRKSGSCSGDTNGGDAFDPAIQWDGFANDVFAGLGTHSTDCTAPTGPALIGSSPADNATEVAADANIVVTFNRDVNVIAPWYTLTCQLGGTRAATESGSGAARTIDPVEPLPAGDRCTVAINAANVRSLGGAAATGSLSFAFTTIGSMTCGDTYTPIPSIQGITDVTPLGGRTVWTEGVVVADYEGAAPALRGYYIQDPVGDGDPTTSDGLFVFNGNANSVSLGDRVRVRGQVAEFQGQTQISTEAVTVCSGSNTVAPVDVAFPVPSATALESVEGMLVRVPQTMYVTEHFQLGRFGHITLSGHGRLQQPTDVVLPGGAANALAASNALNAIIVDDAVNRQNTDPIVFSRTGEADGLSASNTLRGGDQITGLVGVMTYGWAGNSASPNAWRIRPLNVLGGSTPVFTAANPRPVSAPAVGGSLKVASFNLLNYFNTFDGLPDVVDNCRIGTSSVATDCRGADTPQEFERQRAKTIAAIVKLNADIVGLVELENDGYDETSAIADLVSGLNATMGAGTWAYINADSATGQTDALGTDAIKVGFIYRPARVQPVGTTAVLNSTAFVNGGEANPLNRPALVQAFEQPTGGRAVFAINHFKSKGSACAAPDANDGQGNCNLVRVKAAQALSAFLASDPTGTGDPDALILGDLNSYSKEDPIRTLEMAGFTNLRSLSGSAFEYSYVFDGQWGSLDHALASSTLRTQVTGFGDLHINADEPSVLDYNVDFKTANLQTRLFAADAFRTSDHDPVLVGLELRPHYRFGGFQSPLSATPGALNEANSGQVIPIKFSLGGYRGMDIFAGGAPRVQATDCTTGASMGAAVAAQTAGNAGLNYDAATDTYVFLWRTDARWKGSCRDLIITFADGESSARARFVFER